MCCVWVSLHRPVCHSLAPPPLLSHGPPADQVYVTVRSRLLGLTPLLIALDLNLPAMVRELVTLAARQHTPPTQGRCNSPKNNPSCIDA